MPPPQAPGKAGMASGNGAVTVDVCPCAGVTIGSCMLTAGSNADSINETRKLSHVVIVFHLSQGDCLRVSNRQGPRLFHFVQGTDSPDMLPQSSMSCHRRFPASVCFACLGHPFPSTTIRSPVLQVLSRVLLRQLKEDSIASPPAKKQYGEYKPMCTLLYHILTSHILSLSVRIMKIKRGPLACIIARDVDFRKCDESGQGPPVASGTVRGHGST